MTRIISGLAGSLRLDVPKSGTRPTSDRVREAIFSSLSSWNMLDGVRVLDLFAGSGALGLESVSRGAVRATFVEKHPPAALVVQRNVDRVRAALDGQPSLEFSVHRQSAQTFLEELPGDAAWDVAFVDPPYDFSTARLIDLIDALSHHVVDDGLIMVERSTRDGEPAWPATVRVYKSKKYGETTLWWLEPASEPASEN